MKFYGEVGYAVPTETSLGVFQDVLTKRNYYGNVIRNVQKNQSSENLNDELNVDNLISIVADEFAYENFAILRYVVWKGVSWKVKAVDVNRPRLILTLGGVYNDQTRETT